MLNPDTIVDLTLEGNVLTYTKNDVNVTGTINLIGKPSAGANSEVFNDYENNVAQGAYSHAEGLGTQVYGEAAHAEGKGTWATATGGHAEGINTKAYSSGAHAEGENSIAPGPSAHAEGYAAQATGTYSHAEGQGTNSPGSTSHAEGRFSVSAGPVSHAEGLSSIASGEYTHAEGVYTNAAGSYQHVQGVGNVQDLDGTYLHIVGNAAEVTVDENGEITGVADENRSNAHTLDWEGNAWFSGDVYVNSTSGINRDEGSKKLATEEYVSGPKNFIIFKDQINNGFYTISMQNGELTITGGAAEGDGNASGGEDLSAILQDFTYEQWDNGSYVITDWLETYNGEASTEMIIPDNPNIYV